MNADPLVTTLIDLAAAVRSPDFRVILGGGFGLYLRQLDRQRRPDLRTLVPGEWWPYPRATEDLDLFLPTALVTSLVGMRALRAALDATGFEPVPEARFLHFAKPWGTGGRVKVDLLTGPLPDGVRRERVKYTPPRVRPRGKVELHAYLTEEAIAFEEAATPLSVAGLASDGTAASVTVHVPQPFTFLLMKLHAFADRADDASADLGRHHALDVYRIVAMLTEGEYDELRRAVRTHATSGPVLRARDIVATFFASPERLGVLRMREYRSSGPEVDARPLIDALADLFR